MKLNISQMKKITNFYAGIIDAYGLKPPKYGLHHNGYLNSRYYLMKHLMSELKQKQKEENDLEKVKESLKNGNIDTTEFKLPPNFDKLDNNNFGF